MVILCICASHIAATVIDQADKLLQSDGQDTLLDNEWKPISKDKFLAKYLDHGSNSKEITLVRSLFPDSGAVLARDEYAGVLVRLLYSIFMEMHMGVDIKVSQTEKERVMADLRNPCQEFLSNTYGDKATFTIDNYAADVHNDVLRKFVVDFLENNGLDSARDL